MQEEKNIPTATNRIPNKSAESSRNDQQDQLKKQAKDVPKSSMFDKFLKYLVCGTLAVGFKFYLGQESIIKPSLQNDISWWSVHNIWSALTSLIILLGICFISSPILRKSKSKVSIIDFFAWISIPVYITSSFFPKLISFTLGLIVFGVVVKKYDGNIKGCTSWLSAFFGLIQFLQILSYIWSYIGTDNFVMYSMFLLALLAVLAILGFNLWIFLVILSPIIGKEYYLFSHFFEQWIYLAQFLIIVIVMAYKDELPDILPDSPPSKKPDFPELLQDILQVNFLYVYVLLIFKSLMT
jgi:hypothetical protein